MRRTNLVTLALCGALAVTARGELAPGDRPRGFGGDARFLNCDDLDLDRLRSKVVVLQLAHTASEPSKEQVAKLTELHEKYGAQGLHVVTVFEEPLAAVEAFVKANGIDYPVVAGVSDLRTRWGLVKGFPTSYVLDVEGKVAWAGNFADRAEVQISAELKRVTDRPWLPATYAEIVQHLDAERFPDARAALTTALGAEKVAQDDRTRLDAALKWIDDLARTAFAEADALRAKDVYDAYKALLAVAERFRGTPAATQADEAVEALLAEKSSKREIDAWQAFEIAFEEAKTMELEDKKKAIRILEKVVAKYRGTAAAEKAKYWIGRLKE